MSRSAERSGGPVDWAARATLAEQAVLQRHVRPVLGIPGTALGVVSWPAAPSHRVLLRWHFWWQAHLLDCAVDAARRAPSADRTATVRRIARSIRLRNLGRWTNSYFDDIAWLGLALQRAGTPGSARAVRLITTRLLEAWAPPVGGIPWRRGDDFFNAPANGPAAILLARNGSTERAAQMVEWMREHLLVEGTGLIADGFHPGEEPAEVYYSYCQGVMLGAEVELARAHEGRSPGDRAGVHQLVAAVHARLTRDGVLVGHGGGNGGLFTGILARYLALVATDLVGDDPADARSRATARALVLRSAEAAWDNCLLVADLPLFGPDWAVPAALPGPGPVGRSSGAAYVLSSAQAERDLSVQLGGWMLTEAASLVAKPLP